MFIRMIRKAQARKVSTRDSLLLDGLKVLKEACEYHQRIIALEENRRWLISHRRSGNALYFFTVKMEFEKRIVELNEQARDILRQIEKIEQSFLFPKRCKQAA